MKNDPRARVYIIDHLDPGTTIRRAIEVSNTTTSPQAVSLYAGGAQIVQDRFIPGPDNALSSWIKVSPSSVELHPGTNQTAEVTIPVPSTATSGESYAVIWAQVEKGGGQINQVNRVGIRVYLDVGPGGYPPTTFTLGALSVADSSDGRPVISSQVDNTGQRAIDISGTLRMQYLGGSLSAGPYKLDHALTIPPQSSAVVTVTVAPELPAGNWDASLEVTADTVTHTVSDEIAIGPGARLIGPASSGNSDTPYVIGGVAAAVLLGSGGGAVLYRRRRRTRVISRHAKRKGPRPETSRSSAS